MISEDSEEDDDRDAQLLRQLKAARGRDDGGLSFDLLVGDLLAPWWESIRRIARWRLHTLRPSEIDLNEIAADVLERVGRAVERNVSFSKPFKYVVADNIEWAALDYARARKRRAPETPHDPTEMPPALPQAGSKRTAAGSREPLPEAEGDGAAAGGLAAQARDFGALIESLGPRDQRILSERFLAGTSPEEIAKMVGIGRGAVDTATHRALRRLSTKPAIQDVRTNAPRSEGEAA